MKKTLALLFFCFTFYCGMAQTHTYDACCRYSKGNVTGDCICPACKKDKDDEKKASQEETKQQMAKIAADRAIKDAADKKAKEEADRKKIADEKKRDENKIVINIPKPVANDLSDFDRNLFFSERKKYEVKYDENDKDLGNEMIPHKTKILYNGKVINTLSNYTLVDCIGPNIFECWPPRIYKNNPCKEWVLQKNEAHLIDASGKRLNVGGYTEFGNGIFITDGIIKVHSLVGDCLNYSDEPERYSSSYKMKTIKADYRNLSKIINETEVLYGEFCDCAGNPRNK